MTNRWKRKAEALLRLAEDQRGTPEGDLAREKLAEILVNHPEAGLTVRDITLKDIGDLHKAEVGTSVIDEPIYNMFEYYRSVLAITFGVPKEFLE